MIKVSHPLQPDYNLSLRSNPAAHTIEELALLPLCGVPAFRALRTFLASLSDSPTGEKPRILILRGEEGTGSLVGQALAKLGWHIVVHSRIPEDGNPSGSSSSTPASSQEGLSRSLRSAGSEDSAPLPSWMCIDPGALETRVKEWGAERVIFGDELDVISRLTADKSPGSAFDGILDTVGGKALWEAGERLLAPRSSKHRTLFTTVVGDTPGRVIPTNRSNFLSSLRTWGRGGDGKVGYAWVNVTQDVDWEGRDVRDTLTMVMIQGGLGNGVRPFVSGSVSLDNATEVFEGHGSVVVKVV
jgi:hypothetical protein